MWAQNNLWACMDIFVSGLMKLRLENLYLNKKKHITTSSTNICRSQSMTKLMLLQIEITFFPLYVYLTATSSFVFLSLTNLATPKFPTPRSFNDSYRSSISTHPQWTITHTKSQYQYTKIHKVWKNQTTPTKFYGHQALTNPKVP